MGEATYGSAAELSETIARLAGEVSRPCQRVVVALEHPPVQLRTLTGLPPVTPRALAALVAHQVGRFFRKNGQPLATDAVWVGSGPARVARAAAVEEPMLEAIVAGAKAAGLAVETIVPADECTRLVLLPTAERAARERDERRAIRRLALAAATVWVAVGMLFAMRLGWERRAVEHQLAVLSAPLGAVRAARRELREAEATVLAVRGAERGRARSLATLEALATALLDSVVITSFSWNADGSGVLSGLARRTAEVLATLDRTGALPAPRLEGPVVRETVGGRDWERFTIVFGSGPGSRKGDRP